VSLGSIFHHAGKAIRANMPSILTAVGATGTVITAYLTGKASWKAAEVLREHEKLNPIKDDGGLHLKERLPVVWRLYVPAAISGTATIGCIVCATGIGLRRTAAVTAAYSISERAFSEYREKVAEKFGKGKEQTVRDEIAQDRVMRNRGSDVFAVGGSQVLCYEMYTDRYFLCDMETLRRAMNDINAKLNSSNYAYLNDFYYLIGLDNTSQGFFIGWDVDKQMDLQFSSVLDRKGRPCLAFDYNYTKPLS